MPFELDSFNQSNVHSFMVPGGVERLQTATVEPTILISLGLHPVSNVTRNVLRVD